MADLLEIFRKYLSQPKTIAEVNATEAYNMWSETYDDQPGNLMLYLDELLFSKLLDTVDLQNKIVYDVGCGTGRHWRKMLDKMPAKLTGFDISKGMLLKLKAKFPSANVHEVDDNGLTGVPERSCDVLVSTLTIAHIQNIEVALKNWCRVMKLSSELIITDFHPDSLSLGAQRTFRYNNDIKAVNNYIHSVESIKLCLFNNGFNLVQEQYRKVDEEVKEFYTSNNALHVYERFFGVSLIYALHFKR